MFDLALPSEPRSFQDLWVTELARQLTHATRPSPFARFERDPIGFMTDHLGEHPWSKQREIALSVRDHRKTAVQSCHESGKSYIASRIVAWWLSSWPLGEAFAVTTAPTGRQVRAILWREINRCHKKGRLPGRTNMTEWLVGNEIIGFGSKPADGDHTAFQGIHARRVLVVIDEGCGIEEGLVRAAESLCANDLSRMLIIGNPDDPTAYFRKICTPGSGWNTLRISAFDTPNFTGEPIPEEIRDLLIGHIYVDEMTASLGVDNPIYKAKVMGEFPEQADDGLIPLSWILRAQRRELEVPPLPTLEASASEAAFRAAVKEHELRWPNHLGVDVGGGHDKSVFCHRRGPVARVIGRTTTPDTMQTAAAMLAHVIDLGVQKSKIDPVGIGHGALDRCKEMAAGRNLADLELELPDGRTRVIPRLLAQQAAKKVIGVNVGERPSNPERFENLRAELYWALRQRFQTEDLDLDPVDDKLAGQLTGMRWRANGRGQICLESKKDMKKRGLASPDEADALMLAMAHYGRAPGDLGITI